MNHLLPMLKAPTRRAVRFTRARIPQVALAIAGAAFAMLVILSVFVAPTGPKATAVRSALMAVLFLLIFLLAVGGFARSLRPPSNAALVLTLPWLIGVALLCRGIWEGYCDTRAVRQAARMVCQVSWGPIELKLIPTQGWLVILLCVLPYLVSFCMALLLTVRHEYRRSVCIKPSDGFGSQAEWDSIISEWRFERTRFRAIESSVAQQALIFGAVVSLTLIVCVLLIVPWFSSVEYRAVHARASATTAIAVAAATVGAFLTTVGRIMVRVASHEAGSRMFAWAAKVHLMAVVTSALFGLLVSYRALPVSAGWGQISAALIGGLVIGFLGGRATQLIVERAAASVSGLKVPPLPSKESDLTKIDGIDQEHIDRFVEEGIASIHHLAHAPTPRLFFLTQYSLRMICDWQSQALLFDILQGTTDTYRIAHGVRGAVDARRQLELGGVQQGAASGGPPGKLEEEDALARKLLLGAEEIPRLFLYQHARLVILKPKKVVPTARTEPELQIDRTLVPGRG